jgi:predicted negative regulator of RcsB-dependent stress response
LSTLLLKKNNFNTALEVFKINTNLHPKSSNIFNSFGEVYLLKKDTASAIVIFKKSLSINGENRSSQRVLTKISEK